MSGFNRPAFFLVIGTIAAAAVVAWRTIAVLAPITGEQWFLFSLFTGLAAFSYMYPIRLEGDEPVSYTLTSAFLFGAAIQLPAGLLSGVAALTVIPEFVRNRRKDRIFKDLFNAANYLLSAQVAGLIVRAVETEGVFGPISLAAVVVAVGATILVGTALFALVLALQLGIPFQKTPVWDLRYLSTDAMISAMGAVIGIVGRTSPWAVVLAVIPLALPHWLLRNIHLVRMADVDPKTGLYNHRYFQSRLPELLASYRARQQTVSVLFADLDYLREVNNTYGHLAGDQVLKQVADVLRRHTRPCDLLARWGGEEFVVVLPGSDLEEAFRVAERLCHEISNYAFEIGQAEPIRATISIGVAGAPSHGWEPGPLLHHADVAMYQAKALGRNQCCRAECEA